MEVTFELSCDHCNHLQTVTLTGWLTVRLCPRCRMYHLVVWTETTANYYTAKLDTTIISSQDKVARYQEIHQALTQLVSYFPEEPELAELLEIFTKSGQWWEQFSSQAEMERFDRQPPITKEQCDAWRRALAAPNLTFDVLERID